MGYQHKFHPVAQIEYASSVSWYLKRGLKVATNFVNAVDDGLSKICSDPQRNPNIYKDYHEFSLRKYPFTIVYTIEESTGLVIIIAIYHQKRQPKNKYR